MKMQLLFKLTFIFIAATAVLTAAALPDPGKWEPIKDLNNPYVKKIANFAVTAYNKRSGKSLKLDNIKKGEYKIRSWENFRLVVAAIDGTATKLYEAMVIDQPEFLIRDLVYFKPV